MSIPQPPYGSVAGDIYDALGPLAFADEMIGWHLLHFAQAQGLMWQDIEDLARDSDTHKGWGKTLDLALSPEDYLPWLAQFNGVSLAVSGALTLAEKRQRIADADGFKRGTRLSIFTVVQPFLTGDKSVIIRERYRGDDPLVDHAYRLQVTTYTSETADPAAVLRAIISQKPAGIVLEYRVRSGEDWQEIFDDKPTWQDVKDDFATWNDVFLATP